jgi:hypothetical protein
MLETENVAKARNRNSVLAFVIELRTMEPLFNASLHIYKIYFNANFKVQKKSVTQNIRRHFFFSDTAL